MWRGGVIALQPADTKQSQRMIKAEKQHLLQTQTIKTCKEFIRFKIDSSNGECLFYFSSISKIFDRQGHI